MIVKNVLRKEAVLWILHDEVKVMKKTNKGMKEATLTDSDTTYQSEELLSFGFSGTYAAVASESEQCCVTAATDHLIDICWCDNPMKFHLMI